jgi:hypothetical protein
MSYLFIDVFERIFNIPAMEPDLSTKKITSQRVLYNRKSSKLTKHERESLI